MKKTLIALILAVSVSSVMAGRLNWTTAELNVLLSNITSIVEAGNISMTNFTFAGSPNTNYLAWNDDEMTMDIYQNGSILQVGQEVHLHVHNNTGVTITDGTVVMFDGTDGASGKLRVKPANIVASSDAKLVLGVATSDIDNGGHGNVTVFGKVRNIDTSSFLDEDELWAGPSGTFVNSEPAIPVRLGWVIRSHATTGIVQVNAGAGGLDLSGDVAAININSDGVILVDASATSDTARFTNLQAAYTAAKSLNPNGAAISTTNRATVVIPPGTYDAGTNTFTLDAEYVDLIALVPEHRAKWWDTDDYTTMSPDLTESKYRPTGTVIEGNGQTVVIQAVSNVNLVGFTIYNYSPDTLADNDKMPFTVRVNNGAPDSCYEKLYFHAKKPPVYNGGIQEPANPMYEQDAAGTWVDCTASMDFMWRGGYSTNLNCYTSLRMENCHAGFRSFGGDWNESYDLDCKFTNAHFKGCTSTAQGFGGCGTWGLSSDETAWFIDCETSENGFGAGAVAGGNFIRCKGSEAAFGGTMTVLTNNPRILGSFTGYAEDCTGGDGSFGGVTASAYVAGNRGDTRGTIVRCFAGLSRTNNLGGAGWRLTGAYVDSSYFQSGIGDGSGEPTFLLMDTNSTIINSAIINIDGDTNGPPIGALSPVTVTAAGNIYNNTTLFPSGLGPNVTLSDTYKTYTETDPLALLTADANNVKDTHIDWGFGPSQVAADDISIIDASNVFKEDVVENALADAMFDVDDVGIAGSGTLATRYAWNGWVPVWLASTITLPTCVKGMSVEFYDGGGVVVTIAPASGESLYLNGASTGANKTIYSSGTIGEGIRFVGFGSGSWYAIPINGTWTQTP